MLSFTLNAATQYFLIIINSMPLNLKVMLQEPSLSYVMQNLRKDYLFFKISEI